MDDPVSEKKSKLVEGAEAISGHLHNIPRAVQGSSGHVPIPDDVRLLQEQAYNIDLSDDGGNSEESQTVAIPKHLLDGTGRKPLRGTEETGESQSQKPDDNPRSRWR